MSRLNSRSYQPSVLDRLIDAESAGTAAQPGYTEKQMVAAVKRDLQDLLNTRQTGPEFPDTSELRGSILTFGLPDFTSFNGVTPAQRKLLTDAIADAITRFEPRLQDVEVTRVEAEDDKSLKLQFKITARLSVPPATPVAFRTVLELTTGRYSIESQS
jgi:type VI secretion system protein ImpF